MVADAATRSGCTALASATLGSFSARVHVLVRVVALGPGPGARSPMRRSASRVYFNMSTSRLDM